jgi:hypothetical protein
VRLLCALAAVVALVLVLPGGALAADPPGPVLLSQGWQFATDPADRGLQHGWQAGGRGLGWEPATIPHVLDSHTRPQDFYGSIGWYRLTFKGPAIAPGLHWALRFDQVRRIARVWLNGHEIGAHEDPYTPFELPASGLREGEANTLVELGRDHATGLARRARARRHARRGPAATPWLRAIDVWVERARRRLAGECERLDAAAGGGGPGARA